MRRKWSPSSKVFALLGVLLGLTAFVIVNGYAKRARVLGAALGTTTPVAVAAEDLPRGSVLSSSSLRMEEFPAAFAPPGALHTTSGAAGRVLVAPVARGEPVTRSRLATGVAGPVAALVPGGFRAFAVPDDLPVGSLRAGDRVDVLATFGGGSPHTETVATGVEVLSVLATGSGRTIAGVSQEGSGPALLLIVTPDQAEDLAFARTFAELAVVVVGPEEVVDT